MTTLERRIVPVLLLNASGLHKTRRFARPVYIGDPINVVRIFNEQYVDELVIVDTEVRRKRQQIDLGRIAEIVSEAFVPITYGGGIRDVKTMEALHKVGVEKLMVDFASAELALLSEAARSFGRQAVVGAITHGARWIGGTRVFNHVSRRFLRRSVIDAAFALQDAGAGEIFLNDRSRDGMMEGYDVDTVRAVSDALSVPVVACGGAGSLDDIRVLFESTAVEAAAAGSLFVFKSSLRGVLVNYPPRETIRPLVQR